MMAQLPPFEEVFPPMPLVMTLRDYFAGKVIQGMLATDVSEASEHWIDQDLHKPAARLAYAMADAMIKARDA